MQEVGPFRPPARHNRGMRPTLPFVCHGVLWLLGLALAMQCGAQSTSFRMTAIFSDQAGVYQFLQLEELSGLDGQHHFAGLTLTVTPRSGFPRTFVFPGDLPDSNTAHRNVLIATTPSTGGLQVDYTLPQGFFPTDGGTVVFAGIDTWTYALLPTDGATTMLRSGGLRANGPCGPPGFIFRPFVGFPTGLDVAIDPAIEFYNAAQDHYFMSSSQPDLDALDSGRLQGWVRTGQSWPVWIRRLDCGGVGFASPPSLGPVCRIYIPPALGDSHFFSASPEECAAAVSQIPQLMLETSAAYFASLPNTVTGACDSNQIPLYRVWNGRPDSNHRYTTSLAIRDQMVARGFIPEGYGPDAVAMCVGGGIPGE